MPNTHQLISSVILFCMLLAPTSAYGAADAFASAQPFRREMKLTAYYSPKVNQCCYVMGSLDADITLNGGGLHGADGTAVYPGMVAAPSSYPFGTRIVIAGLGSFTVHDRGGAIIAGTNTDRLDVWAGEGEEGLARALAFGVRTVTATIYPPGSNQPAEQFALDSLPSPLERLRPYFVAPSSLLALEVKFGDRSASVEYLQEKLKLAGFPPQSSSGYFGETTRTSLAAFLQSVGSTEPSDQLTERAAAVIEAAISRKKATEPLAMRIAPGSSKSDVADLQRTLRFLDLYRGRTDGVFSETLTAAIVAFQKDHKLVGDKTSPGAGTIGPKTRAVIIDLWKRRHITLRADRLVARHRVNEMLAVSGIVPDRQMSKGFNGKAVAILQSFLASQSLFPASRVNGNYGEMTAASVLAYQEARGIVKDENDQGAGIVGPTTLSIMRADLENHILKIVRADGWAAAEKVL